MTGQYALVFVLANYIYILDYLLKHLPNRASLLALLSLFLKVLLLYFLLLLGLLRVFKFSPFIVLIMLWLGCFLFITVSAFLTLMRFTSVYLASVVLL